MVVQMFNINNRKTSTGAVFFLFLIGLVFSFNISDLLYPTENITMVSYENFTQNNLSYSLVKISGKETILLRNSVEMTNQTEIENVLGAYYKKKCYPSQAEIDNLLNLIRQYNESRFDGPANEEHYCMASALKVDGKTIVEGKPVLCVDDATCEFASKLLYGKLYYSLFKDWKAYQAVMRPFANASYRTDEILETATAKLESATPDKMYDAINYIKNSIANLTEYKNLMEKSDLTNQKKLGLCPPLDINDTILSNLSSTAIALEAKLAPYGYYKDTSSYIANSTKARIEFRLSENKAAYYESIFEPLKDKGTELIREANETLKQVVNNTLKVKIEILTQLATKINNSIADRNFTTIEEDLEEYQRAINSTNVAIETARALYNQSLNATREVIALVLITKTKEIGGEDALKFQDLVNKSKVLEQKFNAGNLTAEQHLSLVAEYSEITNDLKEIEKRQEQNPITSIMNNFKAGSYFMGDKIFDLIKSSGVITKNDIRQSRFYIVSAIALISFVSLTSILILVVAIRFIRKKITAVRALMYGVGSFSVIILALVFSGLLYYYLDKATITSDISIWLDGFWASEKDLAIIINANNVSETNLESIKNCALLTKSTVEEHTSWNGAKKNVTIYEFKDKCNIGIGESALNVTLNKIECLKLMNNSEILTLEYSESDEVINFPALIEKYISAKGNKKFYDTCAISKIMVSE